MAQPSTPPRFPGKPYLQRLESLGNAFPALRVFLDKLANETERGRESVKEYYKTKHKRGPGRCYCLKFENDNSVSVVKDAGVDSPATLKSYLEKNPASISRANNQRRLFILEDMDPEYVDILGYHLGVDPLVFSEQMNTWNFTDSWSIPYRGLPSMATPEQSFTLRYYELRTLFDPKSVDVLSLQMSFATNFRRYERWRDIDVPSAGPPDRRHAFVRRCASFWTSQDPKSTAGNDAQVSESTTGNKTQDTTSAAGTSAQGWDAVIMVDPAFAATLEALKTTSGDSAISPDICADPSLNYHGVELDSVSKASLETCLILQDPRKHLDRASLWASQEWNKWNKGSSLKQTPHRSWPYHNGCSTLAPLMFSQVGIVAQEDNVQSLRNRRNLVSALDEMVFYWTKVASEDLIKQTNEKSSNAAYYLLKHVAQHWVHQLELMNTTIAKAEWFSDDYQAKIDGELSRQKWKDDLLKVNEIAKDINYMRRHLNHFWRAMFLNLERLGVQLGSECVDGAASLALRGAQKDFLTIHTRMQPMRNRAEALNSVSNDLANLRAAFRGVYDGEFGLRLSLFASIFFPLSLLASIFSMGDDYRPGKNHFWMFWAIGPPICVLLALGLIYGTQPWKVGNDLWEYAKLWLRDQGLVGTDDEKAAIKQKKIDKKAAVKQKKIDEKAAAKQKKSDKKEKDEMLKGSKNATGSNNRARRKLDEEHAS